MELDGFVKPVTDFYHSILLKETHLGTNIAAFSFNESVDWSSFRFALVGLPFNSYGSENEEYLVAYEIRKNLALLAKPSKQRKIIDLGNIIKGKTPKDTTYAIGQVVAQLHEAGIITILLGGTADLGLGNLLGFAINKRAGSIVNIDSHIHVLSDGDRLSDDKLTLDEFIFRNSEYLFNYTNIGYQSFYVSQKELDLLDDLYFEAYRVGLVRSNIKEFEPLLRDTDIVNFSLNAIKYADSPGSIIKSPNGLTGEDACQLSFYAGLSNKASTFGVYDIDLGEGRIISCILASQIVWYYIEGVSNQIIESPKLNKNGFTRFVIYVNQLSQEFVFYKSNSSNRWWVEVPVKPNEKIIISCTQLDYERTIEQEIPERWWKIYQKYN